MGTGEGSFDASQLLKGTLDLAVLAVLSRQESYGYDVARQVWSAGLADVREASVYGTLSRLFRAGVLTARIEASTAGPHRKYYGLTAAGRDYLADGRRDWQRTRAALDELLDLRRARTSQ